MQRKIVGIFVMMLLIAFSFSSVAAIIDDEKVNKENDKLIQQVIENGFQLLITESVPPCQVLDWILANCPVPDGSSYIPH